MAKKQNVETPKTESTKYEYVLDCGDIIQIWRYDKNMVETLMRWKTFTKENQSSVN